MLYRYHSHELIFAFMCAPGIKEKQAMDKVAVIGSGYWGQNLVRNYYKLGASKTVCDNSPQILKKTQTTYPDITVTTRYEKFFATMKSKALSSRYQQNFIMILPVRHYSTGKMFL